MISKLSFYSALFILTISAYQMNCDDDFFLKAAKSVPRIGRRSKPNNENFEHFFLKASKSVPRIGRRYPVDIQVSNQFNIVLF